MDTVDTAEELELTGLQAILDTVVQLVLLDHQPVLTQQILPPMLTTI